MEGKACEWCQYLQEKGPTNKRTILRLFLATSIQALEPNIYKWNEKESQCYTEAANVLTTELQLLKKPAAIATLHNLHVLCQTHLDFPVGPKSTNIKLSPKMLDLLSRLAVVEMCSPWYFPAYKWVKHQKKSLYATSDTSVAPHV